MQYLILILAACFSTNAFAQIELSRALPCDGARFVKTPDEQAASLSLSKVSREQNLKIGGGVFRMD